MTLTPDEGLALRGTFIIDPAESCALWNKRQFNRQKARNIACYRPRNMANTRAKSAASWEPGDDTLEPGLSLVGYKIFSLCRGRIELSCLAAMGLSPLRCHSATRPCPRSFMRSRANLQYHMLNIRRKMMLHMSLQNTIQFLIDIDRIQPNPYQPKRVQRRRS